MKEYRGWLYVVYAGNIHFLTLPFYFNDSDESLIITI